MTLIEERDFTKCHRWSHGFHIQLRGPEGCADAFYSLLNDVGRLLNSNLRAFPVALWS